MAPALRSTIPALLACAGLAPASLGCTLGTATYHIRFGNGTTQVSLGPGESTTVTVLVAFDPGIGSVVGPWPPLQGQVLGLHTGSFSVTGTPIGGATGTFAVLPGPNHPSLVWPYNFLPGSATQQGTAAGNSLSGVIWGMAFLFTPWHPLPENPGVVWTGTFTVAPASGPGRIDLSFTGLGLTGIAATQNPFTQWFLPDYSSDPGPGATIYVPAPAAALALALAGTPAARRSRREVLR